MEESKLSVKEAAKLLGVSAPLVQYYINHKRLVPIGQFGGAWILDRQHVENFKRERERR